MTKEWKATCKVCGKPLGYSDRSYRNSLQYGLSRPEYCQKHQEEQARARSGMGSPYFHVAVQGDPATQTVLGKIIRPPRSHIMKESEGTFDEARYGLTQDKIRELAAWFTDPDHRVAVVVGPTGSGKSTALPYWLINPPQGIPEDFFTRNGQILVTQPRIIATTRIAKHIGADLLGGTVGHGYDVGYTYSADRNADWRNIVQFCTDGILINSIIKGQLNQYGCILLDEAHERSLNIDEILFLLKERMMLYPRLRLIIASATINAVFFRDFFGEKTAKIIEFEGKRVDKNGQPVSYTRFFADPGDELPYDDPAPLRRTLETAVANNVLWILGEIAANRKPKGDILAFLHGVNPIDNTIGLIRSGIARDPALADLVEVFPLYRELPEDEKDKATTPSTNGKIHVIVSTNIAEASITIDDLAYEVETGVENQPVFNPKTGVTEIRLNIISKPNAIQRWGRTGRTRNGEVYCLYTEDQYDDLFPDSPKPAIQRSSMEEVVLAMKTAGIPDPSSGWIEEPPVEEVNRSILALQKAGAINQEGLLTDYGLMLRSFSYPSQLVDLLFLADDWGCLVEVATLLPVIKNGGLRNFLRWDHNWDAYTKRDATSVHHALMSGCLDDVEFILKIFKAWEELPWLNEKQCGGENSADMSELRSSWAGQNFVDLEVLESIRLERDNVLTRMYSHKKEQDHTYPHIDLTLLNRVRMLLTIMLPDVTHDVSKSYRFEPKPQLVTDSIVTCNVNISVKLEGISGKITWLDGARTVHRMEQQFKNGTWNRNTYSRLFADQFYPIGSRFTATMPETDQSLSIKRTGPLQKKTPVIDERNVPDVKELPHDDDDHVSEETENQQLEARGRRTPVKKHEISLDSIDTVFDDLHASLQIDPAGVQGKTGPERTVEVVGYDISTLDNPVIRTSLVPQPEPFDLFAKTYRYGDDVQVEVTGLLSFVNDFTVALVVREKKTQLEILVESSDMSFTASSWEVKQIPIGTVLTMKVESINKTSRRVRLSMLPFTEQVITTNLSNVKGVEEVKTVGAKVIEVRPDTIIFALEWSKPEEGHSVIVSTYGRKLPKPVTEYTIDEPVLLQVARRKRDVFDTPLQEIPKKASKSVPTNEPSHGLFWDQGFLQHAGRMTYGELFRYKSYANDAQYHRALDRIYWLSNRLHITKVMDNKWAERVDKSYPIGSAHEGIVTSVHSSGAEVDLPDDIHGYAPKNLILNGKENPEKFLSVGDKVTVQVIEVRSEKQELLLSIIQLANDPFDAITEGDVIVGTIADKNEQLGLFVELKPGVTGLLHKSRFTDSPSYVRGARIKVKIYKKDTANRRISLDLV